MRVADYRRSRNVKMSDLPDKLRIQMCRNAISFRVVPDSGTDEDDKLPQYAREIEQGLIEHTKGLYCFEQDESMEYDDQDEYVDQLDVKIRFETAEDMAQFESQFMLMFKLRQ